MHYCQHLTPLLRHVSFSVLIAVLLLLFPYILTKIITLFSIFLLYSSSDYDVLKFLLTLFYFPKILLQPGERV